MSDSWSKLHGDVRSGTEAILQRIQHSPPCLRVSAGCCGMPTLSKSLAMTAAPQQCHPDAASLQRQDSNSRRRHIPPLHQAGRHPPLNTMSPCSYSISVLHAIRRCGLRARFSFWSHETELYRQGEGAQLPLCCCGAYRAVLIATICGTASLIIATHTEH